MRKALQGWMLGVVVVLTSPLAVVAQGAGKPATVAATAVVLELNTDVSSKDAEGKEIRARILEPATLPDGTQLPHNAVVSGTLAAASRHSKEKPNGALILSFSRVSVPGRPDVPVVACIKAINPQGTQASLSESTAKEIADAKKAQEEHDKKGLMTTGVTEVYLKQTPDGRAVVFALGGEVYLDKGVELTVQMAATPQPAKAE